jgi:hypothetical protein
VIAINVPHRHDLSPSSCVYNEVKTFNRKLEKLCKAHENLSVLPVDSERDLYTRHGLHLNTKGKAHIALKVASTIKNLFNRMKKPPIALQWEASKANDSDVKLTALPKGTHVPTMAAPQEVFQVCPESSEGSQKGVNRIKGNLNSVTDPMRKQENLGITVKRSRRHPAKRNDDFLW